MTEPRDAYPTIRGDDVTRLEEGPRHVKPDQIYPASRSVKRDGGF